jgi:outer membrane lipoprotein-sorting protein
MKIRLFLPALAGIALLIFVSGCGQPGGGSELPASSALAATVTSVTASGDFVMSGAVSMNGDAMAVNLAAIKDPQIPPSLWIPPS